MADFLKQSAILHRKRPFCGFKQPLGVGGQRTMISLAHWKVRSSELLISVNELFR